MYNSIIDFIENDTTKIKKILEKYLFAGNTLRFEEDLMHVMIEFGRKIYQKCLKEIEENIRQSEFRKKNPIECEDQLIQDVQKRKSSRNEEVSRKAIPGLEKKQFSWMRSIINAGGTIA